MQNVKGVFDPAIARTQPPAPHSVTPFPRTHNPFAVLSKHSSREKIDQLAAFHGGGEKWKAAAEREQHEMEGKKWEMKKKRNKGEPKEVQETAALFEWKIYVYM